MSQVVALAEAVRYLEARRPGGASRPTRSASPSGSSRRSRRRSPGIRVVGPRRRRPARRARELRRRRRARARRRPVPRRAGHRRARRPPLRAAAAPPARPHRHDPRQRPTSTRPSDEVDRFLAARRRGPRLLRGRPDGRTRSTGLYQQVILDHSKARTGDGALPGRRRRALRAQPHLRRRDHGAARGSSPAPTGSPRSPGQGDGCSISMASASVLAELAPGLTVAELRRADRGVPRA